ncbi:MAG: aldo/keto reductase [Acidobacteria bacterium]|nr:aldo/keto reductase [Acidobacteriota bacterium]
MNYNTLGTSGMRVSPITMGTMIFGNPLDQSHCDRLVAAALDRGINFFDTADVYEGYSRTWGSQGGASESVLGKALGAQRHRAVICTKFGNPAGTGPLDAGLSRRHLDKQLEGSLKRLQTDYVDLFLAHRWDASVGMEDFLDTCDRWIRSGKVRAVGASNFPVWRIAQAAELARLSGAPKLQVVSPKYNLLYRGVDLEQNACAAHYGISIVSYQPLEAGILSGKYLGEKAPEESRGSEKPGWVPKLKPGDAERLTALARMAAGSGVTSAEYAIAWVLSRLSVASVILGWRSESQMESALAATELRIPAAHLAELDTLFPPQGPLGDEKVLAWKDGAWALKLAEI